MRVGSRRKQVKVQEILDRVNKQNAPMSAADVRKIVDALRSEAQAELNAVLVGALTHYRARALAEELRVTMEDAEATAETMTLRVNRLQQQIEAADFALRRAKADKIMLPATAAQPAVTKADQAIAEAERALRTAESNLQAAKNIAAERHRELNDLRGVYRALMAINMPDLAPLRALLDAVG